MAVWITFVTEKTVVIQEGCWLCINSVLELSFPANKDLIISEFIAELLNNFFFLCWCSSMRAMASSFMRFF